MVHVQQTISPCTLYQQRGNAPSRSSTDIDLAPYVSEVQCIILAVIWRPLPA